MTGNFGLLGDLSARWTGDMIAPDTADYELGLTSRGTARLFLDGALLVENTSETVTSKGVSVQLRAGEPHNVRIEYSAVAFSQYQGGQVRFYWKHDEAVMAPAMRDAVADARAPTRRSSSSATTRPRAARAQADRPDLNLPKEQDQLIRRVARANPNTVVVITTGGVTKTSNWEEDVPAILQAWYPGQEQGNAIADIVFGDVNPSGKLPATVPNDESQIPGSTSTSSPSTRRASSSATAASSSAATSRRTRSGMASRTPPSAIASSRSTTAGAVNRRATSRSSSTCATAEPCGRRGREVYIGRLPTRFVATPPRQLAGFARVALDAHAIQRVTVTIPRRSLSYWDTSSRHSVTPAGQFPVYIGGSSEDTALAGAITVR